MKKKYFFLIMLFIFSAKLIAQKHDYIWLFGYDYNDTIPGIEGSFLDFNESTVITGSRNLLLSLFGSVAIMSSATGDLAFYTNGCQIANANHGLMENGNNLNPGQVHSAQCDGSLGGYTAGRQSVLALPSPSSSNQYYLLHLGIIYVTNPVFDVLTNVLYVTEIDMNANEGLGRVIIKNEPVIEDTLNFGELTAVKHANGESWWIFTREYLSNKHYHLLLDETGLHGPFLQTIGDSSTRLGQGSGQANFSPDGSKYVNYSPIDGIHLYDFDRSTGLLSNFQYIPIENDDYPVGGAAFSPNSRYLYITTSETMMQFDTEVEDIAGSVQVVAEYDGYVSPFETWFERLQLGPDCRMYCYCNSCDVIHVIHYPDEPGLACGVEQHAIQLPYPMFRSMPHFPNYRLGPLVEGETPAPPCELVVGVEEALPLWEALNIYPNPARDRVSVETGEPGLHRTSVRIYDALGKLVKQDMLEFNGGVAGMAISGLSAGIYFLSVQSERGPLPLQKFGVLE
ncbi:MAG: T9SS type A sorting domain-containing protein [Saprospiraceae bacterium]|nr:T9SS type A sorting domain-containing protein [Saprospiraceae bacterium]